jgi:hypothetical protein
VLLETATLRRKFPTKEERRKIGQAADEIYAPLREQLERERWGDYIAINVDNGDYAVAADDLEAVLTLKTKRPGIIPVVIRIGYRAVYHFRRQRYK